MKIVFLLTWADAVGGTERAILHQANWLAQRHEVEVIGVFRMRSVMPFEVDPRVRVTHLIDGGESGPSRFVDRSWEPAFTAQSDVELEKALCQLQTDVLVTTTPALMSLAVRFAPHLTLVHQEHRVSELRGAPGIPLPEYGARADAIVFLSEPSKIWYADLMDTAAPRLEVISNSIEEGYRPRSTRQTRRIAWAGRLVREKQPLHAIEAFAKVAVDHPEWTLAVYGDGPELGRAQSRAALLGVGAQVRFMGVSTSMAEEWSKASIALLTSKHESFSLVLVEAMAAGVPPVSYNCPNGPAGILHDGRTGLLVAPGDTEALAAALRTLVEDDELRHRLGEAAALDVTRFSADRVMPRWEKLYAEVVAAVPGARERKIDRDARIAPAAVPAISDVVAGSRAAGPGLTMSQDQLSRVDDTMSPSDVARANLAIAANALEQAGVEYVTVAQPPVQFRLGVREEDRDIVLIALSKIACDTVYVDTVEMGLRVYEPVLTSSRTLRFGAVYACQIEFWIAQDDVLIAPTPTPVGPEIPAQHAVLRLGEREYPTLEALTRKLPGQLDFPIDVVYTWVDGADPQWQTRFGVTAADARYRDSEELRYSMRSLDLFAPWVNHIWIVTDEQRPSWLDANHPRVTIVDHRDIFADSDALPTFNSHAIESQLHHIEGLAEHFLYFNDDFFLGRVLIPGHFFTPAGLPRCFVSPTQVSLKPLSEEDDFNMAAAKNNRRLLERDFGWTLTHAFLHAPYALRRSTMAEIESRYANELAATAHSRVRSREDYSVASSLAHYYGLFTGRAIAGSLKCGFVNVGLREQHQRLDQLLASRGFDAFCLNDFHDGDVPHEERSATLDAFLSAYFPIASQFEQGSARNRAA